MLLSRRRRWLVTVPALLLVLMAAQSCQSGGEAPGHPSATRSVPLPSVRGTLFGLAVQPASGQSYREARIAADRRYRSLDVIRYFDPNLPQGWAKIRHAVGDHPLAISFKAPPSKVVAGRYDAQMRRWFASAPRHRTTWWSYLPEPETAVEQGEYTAAQFRAAWIHLDRLATEAGNPRLKATLTLMCYTLNPAAHRSWRDYYPGGEYVDVLAWDCYNWGADRGFYAAPATFLDRPVRLSGRLGKPWALAETGSTVVPADPAGRAGWLSQLASYALEHEAQFVTYFDVMTRYDYRLNDAASQAAWRHAVQHGQS